MTRAAAIADSPVPPRKLTNIAVLQAKSSDKPCQLADAGGLSVGVHPSGKPGAIDQQHPGLLGG
jgi:hypothetical protein